MDAAVEALRNAEVSLSGLTIAGAANPQLVAFTPRGRPCASPLDAILTKEDVAQVLGVSVRTLDRYHIHVAYPSPTKPRFLYRDVVALLDALAI